MKVDLANLKAASEVDALVQEEGWSNRTYFLLLIDFITAKLLWPKVLKYMKQRVSDDEEQLP